MIRSLQALALTAAASALAATACTTLLPIPRPADARVSNHVDEYHEVEVADPYRWLEHSDAEETIRWLAEQETYTKAWLARADARPGILARLRELWNYTRYGIPVVRGGRTFFEVNDGVQDHPVLYVLDPGESEPRVLLDPNEVSPDRGVAVASWVPSWDGNRLAYAVSERGSDWRTWRVRDVDSGRELGERVKNTKLDDLVWLGSDRGFLYSRYDAPEPGRELEAVNDRPDIYVHLLGTEQDQDTMVLARPEERGVFQSFGVLADRRTLYLSRLDVSTSHNELYVARRPQGAARQELDADSLQLAPLFFGFDARYEYVGDDGNTCWVFTDKDAPHGRVLAFDMEAQRIDLVPKKEEFLLIPEEDEGLELDEGPKQYWTELIPESEDTITSVSLLAKRLIVHYLRDATSAVRVYDLEGNLQQELDLPGVGTVRGMEGGLDGAETFYSFENFLTPPTIYRFDVVSGASELFRRPLIPLDPTEFETYQVFYSSTDAGTKVPMFLTHRRSLTFSGNHPTYLTCNGGFGESMTPWFSTANLIWLEMGGVFAVANVRGGGEYGSEWHEAGMGRDKQNVFDDFSSAARWLVRNDYTTPSKLAIGGEGHGALVVAACVTQNPDLYGSALISGGVLDMVRYHLFTVGWTWAGDYGTAENRWDFYRLLDYSPLHNVRDDYPYPATMVLTADHDDRVVPAHSYKFAATLQAAQSGPEPVLLRVDRGTGRGAQKPTSKRIAEAADRWAFLFRTLGMAAGDVVEWCEGSWYR